MFLYSNWIKPAYNMINGTLNRHQGLVLVLMLLAIYYK